MAAPKDDPLKDLVKAIKKSIDGMAKLLPGLESSVNDIIRTNSTNAWEIEHLLNTISSMVYMGLGRDLYLKLLEYYKTIDAEGAEYYWGVYEEAMG